MTDYTDNRGYPYPSSEREAGNGGLHSMLLARTVARDLDGIDAGWAAELQTATIVVGLSGDQSPIAASGLVTVLLTTVEKQTTGVGLTFSGVGVTAVTAGWYHMTGQVHSRANGTITADAQHRVQLEHIEPVYGNLTTVRMYYSESFQSGILDMYTMIEAAIHLAEGEQVRMKFFHTNTGSDARVVASGTRLTGSLIVPDA